MKSGEVQILTGLDAETIKFYESEKLICIKRDNDSNEIYDDETINQIKSIKLLFKLQIPISKIKDWSQGIINLESLLKEKLKEIDKHEVVISNKKEAYKGIIKELKKNGKTDVDVFLEIVEIFQSEEYLDFNNELKDILQPSLTIQILNTLILSGPLFWLWINLSGHKYEFIVENIIISLICTVLLTLCWKSYFQKKKNNKNENIGCLLSFLGLIGALFLTIWSFIFISQLQEKIFVPDEYLLYMFKPPYSYMIFFFEIELIIFIIYIINKINKSSEWKWAVSIFNIFKKKVLIIVVANIFLIYACVTGITVVTKNRIVDYSFYKPSGVIYSYNDIVKVETGFKGKFLGRFRKNAGEFYYIVNFTNGSKVNLYQGNSSLEDTYLELEIIDDLIMKTSAEKIASPENSEYCDLDQRYIDRFLRIVSNR
ncbi:MerR family transcriptional regulator [Clostridium grantii]|uniref:DNA-binding transcriptional regulator, MerR family n=1 Tax=Clostridium grantii DSM 8605 TaxID=1121316 RepID=A0A1M5QZI4_9CLOT|nr:MerR family transcriptional regulator [Clostridium grantii]SHH19341.1 DNA-binding transcriptional regulator, MerR family [Clostridium grantii DSM 8605]